MVNETPQLQKKINQDGGIVEVTDFEILTKSIKYSTAQFELSINVDALISFKGKLRKAPPKKRAHLIDEFVLGKMRKIKDIQIQRNDHWANFVAFREYIFQEIDMNAQPVKGETDEPLDDGEDDADIDEDEDELTDG